MLRGANIASPSPSDDASPNDTKSSSLVVAERDVRSVGGEGCNVPKCIGGETTSNGETERLPVLPPRLRTSILGEERTVCGEGGESRIGGEGAAG